MALNDLTHEQQFDLAIEGIDAIGYGQGRSLQEAIEVEYGVEMPGEVVAALKVLDMDLLVAEPGDNVDNLNAVGDGPGTMMKVKEIIHQADKNDGDVYMGVELNQHKARVVWDIGRDDFTDEDSDNIVVKCQNSEHYGTFEEAFGWCRLGNIDLNNIHKYDISNSEYNDLVTEMETVEEDDEGNVSKGRSDPTPPEEEELNVSVSRKHTEQNKYYAKEIKDQFEAQKALSVDRKTSRKYSNKYYDVDTLILFPSNSERNLADHYWLGGMDYNNRVVAIANCNVGTYEYLSHLPNVYHIDEFYTSAWRVPIETSKGQVCIANARDKLVLHVVHDSVKPAFEKVRDQMPGVLRECFENDVTQWYSRHKWNGPDYNKIAYAPVTHDELFDLLPAITEAGVYVVRGDVKPPKMIDKEQRQYLKKDVWPYAVARLGDWDYSTVEKSSILSRGFTDLSDGGYELVETMAFRHDDGQPPASAT